MAKNNTKLKNEQKIKIDFFNLYAGLRYVLKISGKENDTYLKCLIEEISEKIKEHEIKSIDVIEDYTLKMKDFCRRNYMNFEYIITLGENQ